MPWIVVIAKAGREAFVRENLLHRNNTVVYYPRILVSKNDRLMAAPLFPRYLFAHIGSQWYYILNTFGVQAILLRNEQPEIVPDRIIEQLQARETDGFVVLPTRQELEQGDKVTIDDGPLQGRQAIHQQMQPHQRSQVLMDILGRQVKVDINSAGLRRVA